MTIFIGSFRQCWIVSYKKNELKGKVFVRKKEKLSERIIFRISKEEKNMLDSILINGNYESQSELLRASMGLIFFFEEKISFSEMNTFYLRGSIHKMFSGIVLTDKITQNEEQWTKLDKKIKDEIEERELEIKEEKEKIEELNKEVLEEKQEMKTLMREQRNEITKMIISCIDILNEIPASMKRRKLDLTEEGKLAKLLYINTKNRFEKIFLSYLKESAKIPQTEIDELFERII